jgi:hypothetical protein
MLSIMEIAKRIEKTRHSGIPGFQQYFKSKSQININNNWKNIQQQTNQEQLQRQQSIYNNNKKSVYNNNNKQSVYNNNKQSVYNNNKQSVYNNKQSVYNNNKQSAYNNNKSTYNNNNKISI